MDPKKLEIVKSTLPFLKEHGETITRHFYQRLFKNHPELLNVFNQTHQRTGHQPKALADAVYAAAANIEDMSKIMPALERIGEKHRSLQIKPEQYPIVGENLLGAIKEILGDGATEEDLKKVISPILYSYVIGIGGQGICPPLSGQAACFFLCTRK
ncbi:globin domain-containing protein [Cytobacillus sp.]|uniref:globin domain-containing protein n=1 Tax=Cytobacillus sp. TaxID=2675269 RepID=UPI0028BEE5B6|nr:globin domain-containing protein [Cytobacillus sp.]